MFCPTLEFVKGQKHYRTWKDDHGSFYGDWKMPDGMNERTAGDNAEHVIRMKPEHANTKPNIPYEIGVVPMDYNRDAKGNVILKDGKPQGLHYDVNSPYYALACDSFMQGQGILNEPGVGPAKNHADAFGELYRNYQMALSAIIAEEQGHSISFHQTDDGVHYSVTQVQEVGV